MTTILAALDTSAAARPVLETAVRIGEMMGVGVEAVHVADGPTETPEALARRAGVPLRLLEGPVDETVLAAVGAPGVRTVVIGARATPGGRRPVGHTARHVLHHAPTPVVVVPPEMVAPGAFRRLLVPLEGTEASSRPVLEHLCPLLVADVDLVVLHVFTDATLPSMLDRPGYDLKILGREFLARHCPDATHVELRPGPVGRRVIEVAEEHGADLVVLSWSQDSGSDRARVVREVLGSSPLPVMLLPLVPPGT